MKEGQNDIFYITDESIAVASSSSLRKKGNEVLYMADPVDEFAVQQPKEYDGNEAEIDIERGTGFWRSGREEIAGGVEN